MKLDRLGEFLKKAEVTFEQYANYKPTALTLKSLAEFGQTCPASKSFLFLKNELPIRIASTMQEVRLLPERLLRQEPVLQVAELYNKTFKTLVKYENCDPCRHSVISEFTDDLHTIFADHSDVVAQMAKGIKQAKERGSFSIEEDMQLHYFLDRFYISRIGIRMLINQHTLLYGPNLCETHSHIGAIDPNCSPLRLAITSYAYSRLLCNKTFGRSPGAVIEAVDKLSHVNIGKNVHPAPELSIHVNEHGNPTGFHELFTQQPSCANLYITGPDLTFCYIPGHLFHMLYELTKNAMRAVVEHTPETSALPNLHILICHAPEDVTIKLSDYGCGMTRNISSQAFKYTFTTGSHLPTTEQLSKNGDAAPDMARRGFSADPERATFSPLAGRGHGLPLSRLYARYMSGDLLLMSTEAHGSSAYIYMKRLPEHARELLPIFNRTSRAVYQNASQVDGDWISGAELRSSPFSTFPCPESH